jgi:hypothetical protein
MRAPPYPLNPQEVLHCLRNVTVIPTPSRRVC